MTRNSHQLNHFNILLGTLSFLTLCLLVQYSPNIFGLIIRQNGAVERLDPNQIQVNLAHLQPGSYYVALGRALGNWDIFLDEKLIASSKGISENLKGTLSLGSGFVVNQLSKPQKLVIQMESTEQWRTQLWRPPVVASYYPGLILQSWLTFNDLFLGPVFAALLLLSITIYSRTSTVSTQRLKALLFFAVSAFVYTAWVAGYPDLFIQMPFSTAIQTVLRALFSISILYFYGTYSRQNRFLIALHIIAIVAALVTGRFFPSAVIQVYKSVVVLAAVAIVSALAETVIRRVKIEPKILQLGLALCVLQTAATVIYLVSGPSFYTLVSPATVAVIAITGMAAVYKEIEQKIIERENAKAELDSKSRLNALATQIAHDIRSPLATLEVALKGIGASSSEYGGLAIAATQRINKIANELLTEFRHTKTEAPNTSIGVATDLVAILKQSVKEKGLEYRQHNGLRIDLFIDTALTQCRAVAETDQLFRCLSNLINNSVEAMNFKGTINLRLSQNNEMAQISITDEGPGIPPEIIEQLGTRGVTQGKATGHGLGLSYVASVVANWGGKLEISSNQQSGTTLSILLARAK